MTVVPDEHSFALLLTHDVDRPYKTYQAPYYALRDRDPDHVLEWLHGQNSFWTFPALRALETDLGVRSAFFFMEERDLADLPASSWLSPRTWRLFGGRYSLSDPAIVELARSLAAEGWEVGLHGSYHSYRDRDRLDRERRRLESIVDAEIRGGRQHYLNLDDPLTWRHQRAIGLSYDATPGSSETFGFDGEYGIRRPFDDEFVVFPLTVMESALPDPRDSFDEAWSELEGVLDEAEANDAVMTVLWHPRFFSDRDFPGHRTLYRWLVESALDRGAWVGAPGAFYDTLDHPDRVTDGAGTERDIDQEPTEPGTPNPGR